MRRSRQHFAWRGRYRESWEEKKPPQSRHQRKNSPRRCSAMLILEKLEENRLHPRVSEKLKNGRRTNVNIHRIMRIVWENGAEKILERRGRNS